MYRSRYRAAVAALAVAWSVVACGGAGPPADTRPPAPPATAGALSLRGLCPATVVVQTDWFAEAEYGIYYQLLGPGYRIDTRRKRLSGPLVSHGQDTGVRLEIRFGGPAIGNQQVSALMYQDKSITIGQVSTDEAIQNSGRLATQAVLAPTEVSPFMIMWDRTRHPDFHTIADIGRAGTTVLYFQTDTYMQYLLGAGILHASQLDGGYTGAPDRWVSANGEITQSGFATSEPYIYQHELGSGKSYDVAWQLLNDTGYPNYAQAAAIRAADKAALAPCLAKLVPILQQAQVDFITAPASTEDVIIKAVQADHNDVWRYSPALADFSVRKLKELHLVGNGGNRTLGDLDGPRIKRMIDILTPIFARQRVPTRAGLTPGNLYTNEFIDPKIGLPG
jgi:hypothetical protein